MTPRELVMPMGILSTVAAGTIDGLSEAEAHTVATHMVATLYAAGYAITDATGHTAEGARVLRDELRHWGHNANVDADAAHLVEAVAFGLVLGKVAAVSLTPEPGQ